MGDFYTKYGKFEYFNNGPDSNSTEKIKAMRLSAEQTQKDLSLDENSYFEKVDGPHCVYYYPTDKLVIIINDFLNN